MKFRVIVADCPWGFSDTLTMSDVKRGAAANYATLSIADLKALPIERIAEKDSMLVIWVPSSLLPEGLEVMKAWGFEFKQTYIWVKTKQAPYRPLLKDILAAIKDVTIGKASIASALKPVLDAVNLNLSLAFGMGRLFRQTHEIAIIGTRGKIYNYLGNKSQRSVSLFPATKHSTKPELLQDSLDLMFDKGKKLEIFARRDRNGWTCIGNEAPNTKDEDIRVSLENLAKEESHEDSTT